MPRARVFMLFGSVAGVYDYAGLLMDIALSPIPVLASAIRTTSAP